MVKIYVVRVTKEVHWLATTGIWIRWAGWWERYIKVLFLLKATGPRGTTITGQIEIVVGLQLYASRRGCNLAT